MPATQQQLDDLLEHLIALTDPRDAAAPDIRCARLARLVLLLAERLGDTAAVHAAIVEAMQPEAQPLPLSIP